MWGLGFGRRVERMNLAFCSAQGAAILLFQLGGALPIPDFASDGWNLHLCLHPDRAPVLAGNDSAIAQLAASVAKTHHGLPGVGLQACSRVWVALWQALNPNPKPQTPNPKP